MRKRNTEQWKRHILFSLRMYCTFFLLMAIVITCCMTLFIGTMERVMGVSFAEADISGAARATFLNVLLLTLICTVIDIIRRKIMIDRPVRQILDGVERIMQGDLNARIPPIRSIYGIDELDIIAQYFNKAAEELSGMEILRTDFISNVSHELKTPLAVMQNYGTLLQQPNLSEEKRLEYAKGITDASRRLANLISNILKLNKLENQQIFPSKETYNLGEQLCECLLSFENEWERKNLEIDSDIEENVYVEMDAELLSLVWNNLFSNAVKFTEQNGRIFLGLRTEGDTAVVQVTDTGCGISQEVGKHIFEKFYQGDTSHQIQGNGLGLALVKRVIDIVGGNISVESEVGKGSTFTVMIGRKEDGTG